jgi:hypothetical protein
MVGVYILEERRRYRYSKAQKLTNWAFRVAGGCPGRHFYFRGMSALYQENEPMTHFLLYPHRDTANEGDNIINAGDMQ